MRGEGAVTRDVRQAAVLRELERDRDLERWLLEVSEPIKGEAGRPDLEQRLEEAERQLQDVLAELQRGTQ